MLLDLPVPLFFEHDVAPKTIATSVINTAVFRMNSLIATALLSMTPGSARKFLRR
jgi:hypothetical protein